MGRIEWTRASQFNWVFDNLGGAALQEAVAGTAGGGKAAVEADGRVRLAASRPGAGQVFFVRGVWRQETLFAWEGFWAEPLDGDLTNYFEGGGFVNQGGETFINLGTPLAPGTPVQVYYLYFTGGRSARYAALNNYPCIRAANRSREDYTYDFAVDRILDLMVILHFAGLERGEDYGPALRFLWQALISRQESRVPPLVFDTFERQQWERGAYLLYRNATRPDAFPVFRIEAEEGTRNRVLHVQAKLPTRADGAWFGYGLDWSLDRPPFCDVDRLRFKVQGPQAATRVHQVAKFGSGSACLLILGDYGHRERRHFVVVAENSGEVGQATFKWSQDGGLTWEGEGIITGDRDHPIPLTGGLEIAWEAGDGVDVVAGDYWTFWAGEPAVHPRRLLVVLNDSSPGDPDPWGPAHSFVHAIPDRFSNLTAFDLPFSQFWRRDNLIDDGDRERATWGTWHTASQGDDSVITIHDREVTEDLFGDLYYTQRQITWDLSPEATAFGAWCGVDPARCSSVGRSQLNFLLKPEVVGWSTLTLRVKVKDAQGRYFYRDQMVEVGAWQRVRVNFADLLPENGSQPLSHPIQLVDLGVPANPPSNGTFLVTDLKLDEHQTFVGARRLRMLEFKLEQQGLQDHEWWLDEVGLNLEATDPYPGVPRLAISLGPYGQNPWRGPTLVHYAHPLGPHLAGAPVFTQTYLDLHRDAQNEFFARYGGVKGPILPVHSRNDLENVALCGEENFGRFSWWPRFRDGGLKSVCYLFNESLVDASGNQRTLTGSPMYVPGICQPGNTAVRLAGSGSLTLASCADLEPGSQPFSLIFIAKGSPQASNYVTLASKIGPYGWVLQTKTAGSPDLQLKLVTSAGTFYSDMAGVLDGNWHMVAWLIDPDNSLVHRIKDGVYQGNNAFAVGSGLSTANPLTLGPGGTTAFDLDYFCWERRLWPAAEYTHAWNIARGLENGSAYPEVGHGLGQYWAFLRLAQYYFVTGDAAAWEVLAPWLAWLDAFGAAEGPGWKVPLWFSQYGFQYGAYDPGAAASVALACLYIFLQNGHPGAGLWARRLLDDLRVNRSADDFGGGYKSDYHYAWLNALVAQAFGLAAQGRTGQRWRFPATPEDAAHFEALVTWMFAHAGDAKPNLLNADLIPFSYMEDQDLWDYAPHYMYSKEMGSLEAVVLMAGVALEWARHVGDWGWFDRLVGFILTNNRMALRSSQIARLTTSLSAAGLKNVVRLRYADFDQDPQKYVEVRDEAAIAIWGEQAADLDFRYGAPVILEDPQVAQLLVQRLLKRLSMPWERAQLTTWLEGVRVELLDTVAVDSDFHGMVQEEFLVFGKTLDLQARRVELELARPAGPPPAWAVDAAFGDESWAIDLASPYDPDWPQRAWAG